MNKKAISNAKIATALAYRTQLTKSPSLIIRPNGINVIVEK